MLKNIDKKTLIYLGIFIGLIILILILIIFLANTGRSSSFEIVEKTMQEAAIKYASQNSNILPIDNNKQTIINDFDLVNNNYMKSLDKQIKKEVCNGKVVIEKLEESYIYIPYLNCGTSYNTASLYEKLLEDNPVVQSGEGLYKINNEYIFRGQFPKNYITFNKILYRIIKIDAQNNIQIVKDNKDKDEDKYPYDNRYNSETDAYDGKNIFNQSRIKEYLNLTLNNIDNQIKSLLINVDWCVGLRNESNKSLNNNQECLTLNKNSKTGLLNAYDFMIASIDNSCNSIADKSCFNYNYLVKPYAWWLSTPSDKDSSRVYLVKPEEVLSKEAAYDAYIRESYYLNDIVRYSSGEGTLEKPYVFK